MAFPPKPTPKAPPMPMMDEAEPQDDESPEMAAINEIRKLCDDLEAACMQERSAKKSAPPAPEMPDVG